MSTTVLLKDLLYFKNSCNYRCKLSNSPTKNGVTASTFVHLTYSPTKIRMTASTFVHFTQYFSKKKLLQLGLWNKKAALKEQGYNGFPLIYPSNFLVSTIDRLL